jgi:hypothetical protein
MTDTVHRHLRAAGRVLSLRHAAVRWFEYAVFVAMLGIVLLAVGRYEGWDVHVPAAAIFSLAGVCAFVAALFSVRAGNAEFREHALARAARRHHDLRG